MPLELESKLDPDDKEDFMVLVDSVVEVGIVDLYGAPTDMPFRFLKKAMDILRKNDIPLPPL